jgi:hypothetical protein
MRRLFWLSAGFGLGVYAADRLRRTATRLAPPAVADRMRASVRDAIDEGRVEMARRELELREVFAAPAPAHRAAASASRGSATGR